MISLKIVFPDDALRRSFCSDLRIQRLPIDFTAAVEDSPSSATKAALQPPHPGILIVSPVLFSSRIGKLSIIIGWWFLFRPLWFSPYHLCIWLQGILCFGDLTLTPLVELLKSHCCYKNYQVNACMSSSSQPRHAYSIIYYDLWLHKKENLSTKMVSSFASVVVVLFELKEPELAP